MSSFFHRIEPKTAAATNTAPFFQAKLTVNAPGDAHEREADQVADRVMRMQDDEEPVAQRMPLTPVSGVQRMCAECEEKEKEKVQRAETTGGSKSSGHAAPSIVGQVLSSGGGRPMDAGTRQFMESRFGQDFGQVRIHTDARAAESAAAIQAKAYTSGRDIVFGAGEYRPESGEGRRLLAHELVHVGQQRGGVDKPVQRLIRKSLVNCGGYNPYSDDRKASILLGNAIAKMTSAQSKRNTEPGHADVADVLNALGTAFNFINTEKMWTQYFPILLKRIQNVKSYIDSVVFTIDCVGIGASHLIPGCGAGTCNPGTEAFSCHNNPTNMVICPLYSTRSQQQKARVFMHEVFHITFQIIDDWGQPNFHNAHCYAQFVALLNGFNSPTGFRC